MDQPVVCLFVTNGDSPIHYAKMASRKKMVIDCALVIKPMGKTFFQTRLDQFRPDQIRPLSTRKDE